MHVAIKLGISITRWAKATNVMIEKDAGNPCIHRLRIIHLFEADFNLYMKMQWGKRLVRRASKHLLLNTGQFGSVPNKSAIEPILLTQLTNDNCRVLKKNMARFDNDCQCMLRSNNRTSCHAGGPTLWDARKCNPDSRRDPRADGVLRERLNSGHQKTITQGLKTNLYSVPDKAAAPLQRRGYH
jgi:hypothetical protein